MTSNQSPAIPSQQQQQQSSSKKDDGPSTMAYMIGIVMLGTSAGFTLYTRKAGSMLRRIEQVTEREMQRTHRGPHVADIYKYGPPTKHEWIRMGRPQYKTTSSTATSTTKNSNKNASGNKDDDFF